jgi:hypothetical protein
MGAGDASFGVLDWVDWAKLKELQDLFHQEAIKYSVYPMDDRSFQRLNATNAGRPDIMAGRTEMVLYAGMTGMAENVFIDTLSRSILITADLEIPKGGAEDVVLSQGGLFGDWSLYVKDGKPKFAYNWLAREKYYIDGTEPLPEGRITLVYDFTYDGVGSTKAALEHSSSTVRKWAKVASRRRKGPLVACWRDCRCWHGRLLTSDGRLRPLEERIHRHHSQDRREAQGCRRHGRSGAAIGSSRHPRGDGSRLWEHLVEEVDPMGAFEGLNLLRQTIIGPTGSHVGPASDCRHAITTDVHAIRAKASTRGTASPSPKGPTVGFGAANWAARAP